MTSINAIKIALYLEPDATSTSQCDAILIAAARLAAFENQPGFEWANQLNDWETVCAAIAHYMVPGRLISIPTLTTIKEFITNPIKQ